MTDPKEHHLLKLAKAGTPLKEVPPELQETLDYCLRNDRVFILVWEEPDLEYYVRTDYDKAGETRRIQIDRGYFPELQRRYEEYLVITGAGRIRLYEIGQELEAESKKSNSKPVAKANPVEALLEDEGKRVLEIARSDQSADDRAIAICKIDPPRFLQWTSRQWAELLGVSDAAIRKGYFWKEYRPKALEKLREGE